jgi:hypothetical protein
MSLSAITINFINKSTDNNNSQIVIFEAVHQSLPANSASWKLQLNCPPGQSLSFTLPNVSALHPFISFSNGDAAAVNELDFSDVENANIVLSGGGDEPLQFSLQSISSAID